MGEVWKARDSRLDRIVAIKTINGPFSERFEREARAISALNHPHICALYDVGEHDGAGYLVMEFVEGVALKGPLAPASALKLAAQICDALDAAHRKGVVHRDLKPDNILVTKAGVKLLDFGLAKLQAPVAAAGAASSSGVQREAEIAATKALTGAHVILGTPQYMAPEQIEGREADARTDLFAFGCVLYELLTGQKAFDGKTPSSTMAAILATDPRPMRELQPVTPPALERLVQRCLSKDPDDRWQTARDLRAELNWIGDGGRSPGETRVQPEARSRTAQLAPTLAAVFGIVAALLAGAVWLLWRVPNAPPAIALEIVAPPGQRLVERPKISPDGRLIAAMSRTSSGNEIVIRRLDSVSFQRLAGTEAAQGISWSPDSRSLAFVSIQKVKRIDIAGGPAQTLCDFPSGFIPFTAWGSAGDILFSQRDGLYRVAASGGTPSQVTGVDQARQENLHGVPEFLPDGRHFLYMIRSLDSEKSGVFLGSLDAPPGTTNRTMVMRGIASALYAPAPSGDGGYLLFEREGALVARAFDPERLQLTGDSLLVAPEVSTIGEVLGASVSRNGILAYSPDRVSNSNFRQFAWFDRSGRHLEDVGKPDYFLESAMSPDGKRLAVSRRDGGNDDIWLMSTRDGSLERFTFSQGPERFPVWSADGTRLAYRAIRNSGTAIYEKPVGGDGPERLLSLPSPSGVPTPTAWSPDGRHIFYSEGGDIHMLADGTSTPYLKTEFQETQAQFSPDGKWVAYTSDESKRIEVYIQSFPPSGSQWMISSGGGRQPRWRSDGKEIFYLAPDGRLVTVPVQTRPTFEHGAGTVLFQTSMVTQNLSGTYYAPSADGQRFLIAGNMDASAPRPFVVLTNWLAGVKK